MAEKELEREVEEFEEFEGPSVDEGDLRDLESTEEEKQLAARQGWRDFPEFKGREEDWRSAKEFLKNGETILPILKERLTHENEKLRNEIREMRDALNDFSSFHKKSMKQAQESAYNRLKEEMRQAAESGEMDLYDKKEKELEDLKSRKAEGSESEEKPQDKDLREDPDFRPWLQENQWYAKDPELQQYADTVGVGIAAFRGLKGIALYEAVKNEVMARFPKKFESSDRFNDVESGDSHGRRGRTRGSRGKRSFEDLPSDAKKECLRFVKQGLLTKEDYVKSYFEDE